MQKIDIEPNGRFSTALKIAIENKGMNLTQVAQGVDSTYEHMRKLVAGRAFPSVHLLSALASALDGNHEDWLQMIEADKLHKKYKTLPELLGISPELEPFEAIIPQLSERSREVLLAVANTLRQQESRAQRDDSSAPSAASRD